MSTVKEREAAHEVRRSLLQVSHQFGLEPDREMGRLIYLSQIAEALPRAYTHEALVVCNEIIQAAAQRDFTEMRYLAEECRTLRTENGWWVK